MIGMTKLCQTVMMLAIETELAYIAVNSQMEKV